jgi:hypothetical protein
MAAVIDLREARELSQIMRDRLVSARTHRKVADLLEAMAGELMCDACVGTGTPLSGKECICNGTGLSSEGFRQLRHQLIDVSFRMDYLERAYKAAKEIVKEMGRPRNYLQSAALSSFELAAQALEEE